MEKRAGYEQRERAHFDRLAEEIGETGSARKTRAATIRMEIRAELLAAALSRYSNPSVLEIGAGAGAFSEFILAAMPTLDLIVCDISPRCIELARERIVPRWPQVQFNVSNCAALDYPAGNFDCVCGCSILHHLPLRETLVELLRVLRPGGIIWFSEPNMLNPQIALQKNVRFIGRWLEDTEDETAFFRWPLARHLRDAGFEDVQIRPFDFLHPATPASLLAAMNPIARAAERVPVLREIAGSLVIAARKPAHA